MTAVPTPWDDRTLDRLRLVGDDPADRAVRAIYALRPASAQWNDIHAALDALLADDTPLASDLPPELAAYLASSSQIPSGLALAAGDGEAVFAAYGPEILMLLGCYSLPAAYAAAKGVQVLCHTEFLERAARLRLFQTAQMVVDVLSPGGLGPRGAGIRAAQKVRLFHAAIRHLILTDTIEPWDTATLGVPINQEDLAGTLMTFSVLVLDGLAKLDIVVPPDQQQAYLNAWRAVGWLMGVDPTLIPANVDEARTLMRIIQRRQVAPSEQGIRLTAALLDAMSEGPFAGGVEHPDLKQMAVVLMRHLLQDEYDAAGTSVADILRLPAASSLEEHCLRVALRIGSEASRVADVSPRNRVLDWVDMHLIDWMLTMQLGPTRALFSVPATLYSSWQHARAR